MESSILGLTLNLTTWVYRLRVYLTFTDVLFHRKGGNSKDRERETYQDVKVNGAVMIKGRYSRTDPPAVDNTGDVLTPRPVPKVTLTTHVPFFICCSVAKHDFT